MHKTELEGKCRYSIRIKNNECYTTVHCEKCLESGSLQNLRCRKNILEILQIEPQTDCLILAKPYEREYRDGALQQLKAMAKLPLTPNPCLETKDYDRYIKAYIRPKFSSARIELELPEGAMFLKSYEIKNERRAIQVAIYRLLNKPENIYFIIPMEYNLSNEELQILLNAKAKLIRQRPVTAKFADPIRARDFFMERGREIISQLAWDKKLNLNSDEINQLADLFAKYTAGFGILEDILLDSNVQDIYVNSPVTKNPLHLLVQGEECSSNIYLSEDDVNSLISRLRSLSGRPFSEANPVLDAYLEEYHTRVTAIGSPLSSNGLAYAFRRHRTEPWTLLSMIANNTLSSYAAALLSFLVDGQASILVTGSRGAGKTSLLSALMLEIPQKYRIITIEDTNELPISQLQAYGWKIQGLITKSAVAGSASEIEPDEALRAALRLGESVLIIGEVRGREARVLYEAMRVGAAGNSVMGTIHGSTAREVYDRVVFDLEVPPSSFKATDVIVVCAPIRPGGGISRMRRIKQITEVLKGEGNSNDIFQDLMDYSAEKDQLRALQVLDMGKSVAIKNIALKWGITIEEALENIALREKIKRTQVDASLKFNNPKLLRAEAVGSANNKFWLLLDEYKQDLQQVESEWMKWYEIFVRG
ncbi:MAG: type II/IV secretion system ATPase subunit [Methanocellales archaeon]